jgi:hypothetical protein
MINLRNFVATGLMAAVLTAAMAAPGLVGKAWSQAFGMVAATVETADDTRGLTIRSEPSESATVVRYLPVGTEIRACNDFRANWARLQSPSPGGWVNMVNLKPKGGEGSVVAVDESDRCLAIRKGPGDSCERVGCAALGQKLKLSGVWSENNFAQLDSGDWVDASKISTDLMTCDTSALPQIAEVPEPDQFGYVQAPPPSGYVEPPITYVPYDGGSYTYAPSYNFGTFGVPYLFGPYCAFGFYPGWRSVVSVVVRNAYPWRHWRGPNYHHPRPAPYAHSGPNVNPNRYNAAVHHGAVNASRPMVNANRTPINHVRARNPGSSANAIIGSGITSQNSTIPGFIQRGPRGISQATRSFNLNNIMGSRSITNYRPSNAAPNIGYSNYSVRPGPSNGGLGAPRTAAPPPPGNSFRAGNFASSALRGSSFRAGNSASSALRGSSLRSEAVHGGNFHAAAPKK